MNGYIFESWAILGPHCKQQYYALNVNHTKTNLLFERVFFLTSYVSNCY